MIYLFTQMLVSLGLAAVAGGAIGWLVHRSHAQNQSRQLRQIINRQQSQVRQAQTELAIVTNDFDDLRQRTQEEIESLRRENARIDPLNKNLEKSQLLVHQLMKKHEAQLRDIANENKERDAKLDVLQRREQVRNRQQADFDARRSDSRQQTEDQKTDTGNTARPEVTSLAGATFAAATSSNADKQTVMSVESRKVTSPDQDVASPQNGTKKNAASRSATRRGWGSAPIPDVDTTSDADAKVHFPQESSKERPIVNTEENVEPQQAEPQRAEPEQLVFEAVDQRDDLQQIFGIGPVTEKALNTLGITSYSQLADLKQQEIQTIADALQIYPSRIEKDDWVGNARRQLEEVLEEL